MKTEPETDYTKRVVAAVYGLRGRKLAVLKANHPLALPLSAVVTAGLISPEGLSAEGHALVSQLGQLLEVPKDEPPVASATKPRQRADRD